MQNPRICTLCAGACCKASGGHIFPSEFNSDITFAFIYGLLSLGLYAVDWWGSAPDEKYENSSRVYYIRYKHKDTPGLLDHSRYKSCILLTPSGCSLSYDKRPEVCRRLIPHEDFKCTFEDDSFSVENCAIGWLPYQDDLLKCLKILEPDKI